MRAQEGELGGKERQCAVDVRGDEVMVLVTRLLARVQVASAVAGVTPSRRGNLTGN